MRIAVMGCSGSGKSTLAKQIARELDYPYIELDQYFHQPNWTPTPAEEFRTILASILDSHDKQHGNWIVDGNYQSKLGTLVVDAADLVIWFNLKKITVMYRIIKRTLKRVILREELWNGNREKFGNIFKSDPIKNILLWAWTQHSRYKEWGELTKTNSPDHQAWIEIEGKSDLKKLRDYLHREIS